MKISLKKMNGSGFAVLEAVLILVIIGAITGIGSYVLKQNNTKSSIDTSISTNEPTAENIAATATVNTSKLSAINSTVEDISSILEQDFKDEVDVDVSSDDDVEANSLSSNNEASDIGDAYNENEL